MLYKLNYKKNEKTEIEPVAFFDFEDLQKLEKDLENLLADNLLNKLFEDNALMPIYQEKSFEDKADIYALNARGELIIFELKRGIVGSDAMLQILKYTQDAGQWDYDKLNHLFSKYSEGKELSKEHKNSFELTRELTPSEFNKNQQLFVIGNAANNDLINSLEYWKKKGINAEFIPYRVYKINEELFFEFYSKPNDIHFNPKSIKGLLFDTNRTYDEECVWEMIENNKVSAYGDVKYFADYLFPNDIVFLSHRYVGIIGAVKVTSKSKTNGDYEKYVDVQFLTQKPKKEEGIKKSLSFSEVREILGKNFYWARTIKVPYLSKEESNLLLEHLKERLE